MDYREYFKKFNENDIESTVQFIPNEKAEAFLLENAPRLYCPDKTIEDTFAFRTWVMRKHIRKTDAGFLITEFLPDVYWAGKYNTINAPLVHHLNEFRWLKNADDFLDYISFFIKGEGSAYSYHVPALKEMCDFCFVTGNERFLSENIEALEKYFEGWEESHLTKNGLYWSIDDREGTEYSISGTTTENKFPKGLRPIMNSCMYADALALSKISKKGEYYREKAENIKRLMDEKLWDGSFYKAIHPLDGEVDRELDFRDIPPECNAKELMGYMPWVYGMPDSEKAFVFADLKDERVFKAKTGLSTADRSNARYMYPVHKPCSWNGKVWPFATSIAVNAVIELLRSYTQSVMTDGDLYELIKVYAEMHYIYDEQGNKKNFIDEVMLPDAHIWDAHEWLKGTDYPLHCGGPDRGKDYNHSTFIDLVLRGLCGVDERTEALTVKPRIAGIWKWFKIENLTYRKRTYTVYYDEDGTVFGKGKGIIIE